MKEPLKLIKNWDERARAVKWKSGPLGKASGVSASTLFRHFIETKGMSPRDWLNEDRLSRAPALLKEGYSVKETGRKLGYEDQHHFSRAFKKRYACTPSGRSGHLIEISPIAG